ncbi:unnamed protein product [Pseudo-nitzschia multistriata]|uniref:Uncharacterized protein n=1 Tax=Pseudo-nitzschia multistriata TaxID=183589 RepID=A0A448YZW5_9STRA|nr:unnamed protein product [Pseudo-nitzschia multistriata]
MIDATLNRTPNTLKNPAPLATKDKVSYLKASTLGANQSIAPQQQDGPQDELVPPLRASRAPAHSETKLAADKVQKVRPFSSAHESCLLQECQPKVPAPRQCGGELREDGLLWSSGSRTLSLLEGMDSTLVPTTSYSLLPTIEENVFGTKARAGPNSGCSDDGTGRMEFETIGYTHQKVGELTIVRPILLLPGVVGGASSPAVKNETNAG